MPLNVAVVGVGFMGQLHARSLADCESARLVAIVDRSESLGRGIATRYGCSYFRSVEDALEAEQVHAFVVALPDRHHVEVAAMLLRAGKPVLLEKPIAHSVSAARQIARAEREGGGRLLVGQLLRFDPRYVGAAKAVADGVIGEPLHARAGRIASRAVGTRMNGTSSVLFYLGVHDADAIQWITGQHIRSVYSRAVAKLMPSLGVQSEDAILSVVEFDNGAIGQLFSGWTRTESDPIGIDGRLEVYGTGGLVDVDVRDHGLCIASDVGLSLPDALHWPEVGGTMRGDLAAETRHFVRAIREDKPFAVTVEDAMRAVAVNDAILRSVNSGTPQDVEVI